MRSFQHRIDYAERYFRRLEDIHERIAEENPVAAERMVQRVRTAVARLARFPALGRPGRVADTRELLIPNTPYIAVYRVTDRTIQVLALMHSAQRWPDRFP